MKKNMVAIWKRVATLMMAIAVMAFMIPNYASAAATPSTLISTVKSSVGSKYPFSSGDAKTSSRMVCGATASKIKSYSWYMKESGTGNSKVEYILFIGKASSKANAKKAKAQVKSYVTQEGSTMNSYLSEDGKKVFKNAQVGYKGKYVYCVAVSPSATVNKNAVKAIKKKM